MCPLFFCPASQKFLHNQGFPWSLKFCILTPKFDKLASFFSIYKGVSWHSFRKSQEEQITSDWQLKIFRHLKTSSLWLSSHKIYFFKHVSACRQFQCLFYYCLSIKIHRLIPGLQWDHSYNPINQFSFTYVEFFTPMGLYFISHVVVTKLLWN